MKRNKKAQASRISSYTKRKKNPVKCRVSTSAHAQDSNLGPLVYEASVLPTELSFRMKNWEQIMTIYIWFLVQQMYVSLTYPFNTVQHTLSHIVEHRKLDSLATPDSIVWSTVTSCWTSNVRQFDPSLIPHLKRRGPEILSNRVSNPLNLILLPQLCLT